MASSLRRAVRLALSLGTASIALYFALAGSASAQTNVLFIVDSSGSMRAKVEGNETRMSVAKRALSVALKDMPKDMRLGMMLYGHRRAKDCKDIELVAPIASEDANSLAARVEGLQPRGETPIAAALELAARSFAAFKGQNNIIVLVTDGIEECGGDPCAAARAIKAAGLNLKAHIIGFTLNDQQRKAIECVAKETGGTFFPAQNPRALRDALQSVKKQIAEPGPPSPPPPPPAPPERFNLIGQKNGGEMIFGSGPDWARLIDDRFDYLYGFSIGAEGVFAFREGRAATFDTFAVFLPSANAVHPKEIEVFAGDEGPAGAFRSLGVVTVANGKMRDGWQEFKLPQTTAKFFKAKILSNHGGNGIYLYEFRLYGDLAAAAGPATPGPATPGPSRARTNILSQQGGGEMIFGSGPQWARAIDGKFDYLNSDIGSEGVFGFRDGRAATFDTFAVFLPGANAVHPKEIEVFAGIDGPAGTFRSLGVVTVANGKMRDGWQEFKLPQTTAKFFKIKILSNHGGNGIYFYEFGLYGELAAAAGPEPARPGPATTRTNILAQQRGGEVLLGSSPDWKRTIDGQLSYLYGINVGGEAVFAFQGGRAATFEIFGVYIPNAQGTHPKEIELFAGDEGPAGTFRSLGVITVANGQMRDGWQDFKLPETTAKFFKVKILSNHGGNGLYLYELRLMGDLK